MHVDHHTRHSLNFGIFYGECLCSQSRTCRWPRYRTRRAPRRQSTYKWPLLFFLFACAAPLDMYMGTCTNNTEYDMPGFRIFRTIIDNGATALFQFYRIGGCIETSSCIVLSDRC